MQSKKPPPWWLFHLCSRRRRDFDQLTRSDASDPAQPRPGGAEGKARRRRPPVGRSANSTPPLWGCRVCITEPFQGAVPSAPKTRLIRTRSTALPYPTTTPAKGIGGVRRVPDAPLRSTGHGWHVGATVPLRYIHNRMTAPCDQPPISLQGGVDMVGKSALRKP